MNLGENMYAEVLIQYGVKSLDRVFTYHIPEHLQNKVSVGVRVSVPFNKKNINGFVINLCNNSNHIYNYIGDSNIIKKIKNDY